MLCCDTTAGKNDKYYILESLDNTATDDEMERSMRLSLGISHQRAHAKEKPWKYKQEMIGIYTLGKKAKATHEKKSPTRDEIQFFDDFTPKNNQIELRYLKNYFILDQNMSIF